MGARNPVDCDVGTFIETERSGTSGGDDTAATGDRIGGFGTGAGEARVVTSADR